jgi:hypothetical protein
VRVNTATEDRVLAEVKRLCCSTLDEATLQHGLAERLRQDVPFDAYCFYTNDPASELITRAFAENLRSETDAFYYFTRVYLEDEIDRLAGSGVDRRQRVAPDLARGDRKGSRCRSRPVCRNPFRPLAEPSGRPGLDRFRSRRGGGHSHRTSRT